MASRLVAVALGVFIAASCGGSTDVDAPVVTLPFETRCTKHLSEPECCAMNTCTWVPAQGGVPEQCVPSYKDTCLYEGYGCPQGMVCVRRDFPSWPCVDTPLKEGGEAYFCHDRCPPDAKWRDGQCAQATLPD